MATKKTLAKKVMAKSVVPVVETLASDVVLIPYSALTPGENDRTELEGIDNLADSIAKDGLISNLTVRRGGNGYIVIAGHRRHAAIAKVLAKQPRHALSGGVPCRIVDLDDTSEAFLRLAENVARQDLNPIDLCNAVEHLSRQEVSGKAVTSAQIGKRLGLSAASVNSMRRVAENLEPLVAQEARTWDTPLRELIRLAAMNPEEQRQAWRMVHPSAADPSEPTPAKPTPEPKKSAVSRKVLEAIISKLSADDDVRDALLFAIGEGSWRWEIIPGIKATGWIAPEKTG